MKFLVNLIKAVLKLLGNPVQDVPKATPTPPPMPKTPETNVVAIIESKMTMVKI